MQKQAVFLHQRRISTIFGRNCYIMKILINALVKLITGATIMALLLFVPAGTLAYRGAWRLIALLFIPMLLLGTALLVRAPETLQRRLNSKEKRKKQDGIVKISGALFILAFIVAGLDFRFGWSNVGKGIVYTAGVLFIISYALYAEVTRENKWLSRTVETSAGQKVVSNGLYGIVRHPMYTATIVMFLSMPLVLGSWWAFIVMITYIPIIAARIKDEEQLLKAELDGYTAYCRKVRWRLVPYLW